MIGESDMQKRITAIYIALLLICAVVLSCVVLLNRGNDTEVSGVSANPESPAPAISSPVIDDPSLPEEESSLPPADESSIPEETSDDTPKDSIVRFLACPDNIIHPSIYYDALIRACAKKGETPVFNRLRDADYDFASIYEYVAPVIRDADIASVNVETLIGGTQGEISGYPTFNTPEKAGYTLCDLGFDVFNLAHNHMLDSYNDKYLINCNRFFTDLGKVTIGYYKNKADTDNIRIVEKNGIKIAFLAYTFSTNGVSLQQGAETYIPYFSEELIEKQVALAKSQADVIVASCHWGDEDTYTPNAHQKKYADLLVRLNVDVILGMHPHVIQPMEWRDRPDGGRSLLVYSLGNFVSTQQELPELLEGMASFTIQKSTLNGKSTIQILSPEVKPMVMHYNHDNGEYGPYMLDDYTEELASSHSVRNVIGDEFTLDNLKAKFKEIMSMNVKPSTNTNLLNVKFDWEGNMIDKTTGNIVEDTESIHSWEYQADTSDGTEDSSDSSDSSSDESSDDSSNEYDSDY